MVTADRWKCYFAIADAIAKHKEELQKVKSERDRMVHRLIEIADLLRQSRLEKAAARKHQKAMNKFNWKNQDHMYEGPEKNHMSFRIGKMSKLSMPIH